MIKLTQVDRNRNLGLYTEKYTDKVNDITI